MKELWNDKPTRKSVWQQIQIINGTELFVNDLTQDVFRLTQNYRTRTDPEFGALLGCLRVGNASGNDGNRLMRQCLWHHRNSEWEDKIKNVPKTIYLYTRNCEKNGKNMERLIKTSAATGNPVAKLQCQWRSNRTQRTGKA